MKYSIPCCKSFPTLENVLSWFYYEENGSRHYVMPCIVGYDGEPYRVNFCPICGTDIRGIEKTTKLYE